MTNAPDTKAILETAREACRRGGEKLKAAFGDLTLVKERLPHDIKSFADTASEEAIRKFLSAACPDDHILGEEEGGELSNEGGSWVVDPLDGTINFSHAIPYFAVTAAYFWQGKPLAGVIHDPLRGTDCWALKGEGAFKDGKKISVSQTKELKDAMVFVGCGKSEDFLEHWRSLERIVSRIHSVRFNCCATLDLCALSEGRCDAYRDLGLYLWDFAAGALILEEAGGFFEAKPGKIKGTYDCLGANPALFDELKKLC
ncbi:inositol monophosphatase [bacterium]|nr:inositol monophosphatase [bacterium]